MQLKKLSMEIISIFGASLIFGFANQAVNPNRIQISQVRPVADVVSDAALTDSVAVLLEPLSVDKAQLKRLIQEENAVAIDARMEDEFAEDHIPGAINLPFDSIGEFLEEIDDLEKDQWVICYCDGPPCDKGRLLANVLFDRDFIRVAYYDAGLEDWKTSEEAAR